MKYLDKYIKNPITRQGAVGAGGISLGAALLMMGGMSNTVSGITGVLMILAGVFISHHKPIAGLATIGVGLAAALTVIPIDIPTVKAVVHEMLQVGGIGAIGYGGWNLFQFIDKRRKSLEEKKDDTD